MSVLADLRYSAKSLARRPGLTVALLLTIALGVGANASVFGFIRGMLTPTITLPGIDRVVSVVARDGRDGFDPVSYDVYQDLRKHVEVFDSLGAIRESQNNVIIDKRPTVMAVAAVSPDAAALLQLSFADGVVITRRAWMMEFGSKGKIRGQMIRIDGAETRVAGVAPDWLEGLYTGSPVDIWVPLQESSLQKTDRASRTFETLGRLHPGMSVGKAEASIDAGREASDQLAVFSYTGLPPAAAAGMSRLARLLPMAAVAVFLVACANVAAFLLSRSSARAHETAVRVALGASRGQLRRQLLADSVLLSAIGATCGVLFANWTAHIIPALFFDEDAAHLIFDPNLGAIVVAALTCTALTIVSGLLPLFEIRDDDPALVLRRESAGPSPAMRRVRSGLVVGQMACCCLLVIVTGLLFQGFRSALQTSTSTRLGKPILATVKAAVRFSRPDLGLQYFEDVEAAARTAPGVMSAAWVATPPGARTSWTSMRVEPPHLPMREVVMDVVPFVPSTLASLETEPVAGRMFGGEDTARSCRVAVVNTQTNQAFFNGDAVGRSIANLIGERALIVGVVTARKGKVAPPAQPTIYYYAQQTGMPVDQTAPATFRVPIYPTPDPRGVLDSNIVSRDYFASVAAPLIDGTLFPEDPDGCRTGVVNQEASELYFGGRAVGGAIIEPGGIRTTIVGVVRTSPLRATERRLKPTIFLPLTQNYLPLMTLMLGSVDGSEATMAALRQKIDTVGGGEKPAVVMTLDAQLSRTALASERIATILVGASAATALALALLGIYGAMSDFTHQRRREIALRLALGAQGWRVMGQVVREGVRLAGIGGVTGLVASVPVSRWLAGVSPHAGALSVWIWLAAAAVLMLAVMAASVVPAGRTLAVDPLTIMRDN